MQAEILERRTVYDRWSTVSEVLLKLPNGAIEKRIVEDHGQAAAVLLYDPDRLVALLVRQPRAPLIESGAEDILEAVAGRLDGKSGEATARAEAWEEAGVRIGDIDHVTTLWMMPAVSTEQLHLYLAPYAQADRTGTGGGAEDENECITIVEVPLADLRDMAASGTLTDGKTLLLLQALMLRQPELFR